ncbi:hypothetical protein PCC7424_2198 [Gloeothece citriformis PCC 7424]|uniref:Uncharacterized protein n=1 Tax=Gloeothece citriformis (strain PCC 7424) TaxID=65393 RepID=B7KGE9_GLOC7|nr:hypothetical protein [Gloeothece citriformis]ACK70620.1 hypothetical protein PCC7424_2198 [Gloeothece citriformis PCC 7424]
MNKYYFIDYFLKQLQTDYQKIKEERHQIALGEDSQEFTILGVIEIFTTDLRGYAFQILNNASLENPQKIIKDLQKLQIFDIPYFIE